jgi:hypothetical protein
MKFYLFFLVTLSLVSINPIASLYAFTPTASAGYNQIVEEGVTVTLDASASTHPKSLPLKFTWNQVGGPDVALADLSRVKTSFLAPTLTNNEPVLLTFDVMAEDNNGHSNTDTLRVMVLHRNKPPFAAIDSPVNVDEQSPTFLDASKSSDPDEDPLNFIWRQIDGPSVVLSSPRNPTAVFISPSYSSGEGMKKLEFELTVRDDQGLLSTSTARIMVTNEFKLTSKAMNLAPEQGSKSPLYETMERTHETRKQLQIEEWAKKEMLQAKTWMGKKDFKEAQKHVERALTLIPSHEEAFQLFNDLQKKKDAPIQAELILIKEKFIQRDYLESLSHINKLKELDPTNRTAQAFLNAALEALQQEARVHPATPQMEKTGQLYKPEKNTALSQWYYTQGLLHYSQGQVKQAMKSWKKSLSMDRDNRLAMNAFTRVTAELKESLKSNE